MLCAVEAPVTLELAAGLRLPVRLRALGADWIAAESSSHAESAAARTMSVIPLHAISGMTMDHGMLLASLDPQTTAEPALRERMTFGFVLRDLARRRVPVRIALQDGGEVHGTIDRAGADHLDLAVHDAGEVRRAEAVQGFRIVPFSALLRLRTSGVAQLP